MRAAKTPAKINEKTKAKQLKNWNEKDGKLVRVIKFKNFMDGLYFVTSVAHEAEKLGHHPDVCLKYGEVTFVLTTHEKGAVTEKDIQLAHSIDALYGK